MKLKVGDIEMDSQTGISFGAQPAMARAVEERGRQNQTVDKTPFWKRLPAWSPRVYLTLAVLAVAAAMGLALVSGVVIEAQAVGRFIPLIPVPGLLFAAGVAFRQAAVGGRRSEQPFIDALDLERSDKLAGHLAGRLEPASVEELMAELAWREEAVVDGLKAGVSTNQIVEDLDLDTGHWIYSAASLAQERTPQHALPIAERAKQLTTDK